MASPYSTQPNLPVVVTRTADEPSMPAEATGTLFALASGFGIGALVMLFGFLFLIGIGQVGHPTTSGPAAQSAATAPAAPDRPPTRRRTRRAAPCRKPPARPPPGQSEHTKSADRAERQRSGIKSPSRRASAGSSIQMEFLELAVLGDDRGAPCR